jgi:hypothetical protein
LTRYRVAGWGNSSPMNSAQIKALHTALEAAYASGQLTDDSQAWLSIRVTDADYAAIDWPEDASEPGTPFKMVTIGRLKTFRSGTAYPAGIAVSPDLD